MHEHWQGVYTSKGTEDVSWFQREPSVSLRLLASAGVDANRSVIDIGAGASPLADRLLDRGVRDITALDIAEAPLAASRTRLGVRGSSVSWLVQDVLRWEPARRYDIWHDRAVFHFLTEAGDRDRYRATLMAALAPDGWVAIGTFAQDGPETCSGLPVRRYSPDALAQEFDGFEIIDEAREEHHTPWQAVQPFTWLLLRRT